jgi:hypothetical protein
MITVEQLIQQLQKLSPKAVVILQKDSEGNGYSSAVGVEQTKYLTDEGDISIPHEDDLAEWSEKDKKSLKDCVVIWPSN